MATKNKELLAAANKRYRARHAEKIRETRRNRATINRQLVTEYKESRGCHDCGIMYPSWILDLDHMPGSEKVGNVSMMCRNYSTEAVLLELEKCEVVCANCHRDRTHDRLTLEDEPVG